MQNKGKKYLRKYRYKPLQTDGCQNPSVLLLYRFKFTKTFSKLIDKILKSIIIALVVIHFLKGCLLVKTVAQIIGIIAMILTILSYQSKTKKGVILTQLFSTAVFTLHYFLLGFLRGTVLIGFFMNILGVVRSLVYYKHQFFKADKIVWIFAFFASYVLAYSSVFLSFGMKPTLLNLLIEALPILGMTLSTVSFRMKNAFLIRILCLAGNPLWLAYNLIRGSIGGTVCEIFSIISIVSALIRLDILPGVREKRGEAHNVSDE